VGRDGGSCRVDLPDVLSGIFFAEGLDRRCSKKLTDLPVGQIYAPGSGPDRYGLAERTTVTMN